MAFIRRDLPSDFIEREVLMMVKVLLSLGVIMEGIVQVQVLLGKSFFEILLGAQPLSTGLKECS